MSILTVILEARSDQGSRVILTEQVKHEWYSLTSTSAEEKNTAQPYTDVFFDGDEIKLCRGNSVESFPRSSFGCFISG